MLIHVGVRGGNRKSRRAAMACLRKDESGQHGGGGDSNGQQNNGGQQTGNNGGGGGDAANPKDNGGDQFDPASFWNQPEPERESSPQGGNGQQEQTPKPKSLMEQINESDYGEVMSEEAFNALNGSADGSTPPDRKKFNDSLNAAFKEVQRKTLAMAFEVMKQQGEQIKGQYESAIEAKFGNRDAESALAKEFASYDKPGMKPLIDGMFSQAMKVTKNDRQAAINMTRLMLGHQAKLVSGDLGLNEAPGGPLAPDKGTDMFESLGLGRP